MNISVTKFLKGGNLTQNIKLGSLNLNVNTLQIDFLQNSKHKFFSYCTGNRSCLLQRQSG
jgi:hypothetical protein